MRRTPIGPYPDRSVGRFQKAPPSLSDYLAAAPHRTANSRFVRGTKRSHFDARLTLYGP